MSAKTTQIHRGALLAKESLKIPAKSPNITIEQLEKGNRLMRRIAKKQRKSKP